MTPKEFHTSRMLPKGENWTDRDAFLFAEAYHKAELKRKVLEIKGVNNNIGINIILNKLLNK